MRVFLLPFVFAMLSTDPGLRGETPAILFQRGEYANLHEALRGDSGLLWGAWDCSGAALGLLWLGGKIEKCSSESAGFKADMR